MKEIKTKTEHYFKDDNDLKQGEYKNYYDDGSLLVHCFYKDGKKHGEFKRYYLDGLLDIHSYYKDDILHGECKSYYYNGSLKYIKYFSNDKDITHMYNKLQTWKTL